MVNAPEELFKVILRKVKRFDLRDSTFTAGDPTDGEIPLCRQKKDTAKKKFPFPPFSSRPPKSSRQVRIMFPPCQKIFPPIILFLPFILVLYFVEK